jgi:hypothetical protein
MRLNHVEMTVPRQTLSEQFAADLDQLLVDIFGWAGTNQTMTNPVTGSEETTRFYQIDPGSFLALHEHDDYMRSGNDDHFGIHVEPDKLDHIFERCQVLAGKDDRLSLAMLTDGRPSSIELGGNLVRGFYVRYLLPVYIDVQTSVPLA